MSNDNQSIMSRVVSFVIGMITHSLAFFVGGFLTFAVFTAGMSEGRIVKTDIGKFLCMPFKE